MSAGPSLYRRHRPRTFEDVVGQAHVVRTLRNAVEQGKVHHAYLFVGTRGTGKTSMAKILAACLNCTGAPTRPTVAPCGACPSCVSIAGATSLDVIEMDAASNNSVDDVRELRESVAFAPVSGGSKVYILDEAHMLSTAAWNAFLKTLEEPPPNTIFVLATTEADRVLPTVADRCHRFDFQRPTVEQLASVVGRVADKEEIAIPPDAVALLARHATGSFRDALGTLEQLVTYSGRSIALEDVLAVLGVAADESLFGIVDAVASGRAADVLRAVASLADQGREIGHFARQLEGHVRDLLIVQTLAEVPREVAVTAERDARLLDQAQRVSAGDVVRLLDLLTVMLRAMRDGADPRTQLELALVKAATPATDATTKALMARIERLEHRLASAAPGGGPAAGGAAPVAPAQAVSAPVAAQPPSASSPTAASPVDAAAGPGASGPPPVAAAPPLEPVVEVVPPPATAHAAASSAPSPSTPPSTPHVALVADPAPAPPATESSPAQAPPAATSAAETPAHAAHEPPVAEPPPGAPLDLELLVELWPAVLTSIREQTPMLGAVLAEALPVEVRGDEVVVAFDTEKDFLRRKAEDRPNRDALVGAIRGMTGMRAKVVFDLRDLTAVDPVRAEAERPLSEDELLARLKTTFDAEEVVSDEGRPADADADADAAGPSDAAATPASPTPTAEEQS